VKKLDIYVVRTGADGSIKDSKPCRECLKELKRTKLFRYCYYSTEGGTICKVRMSELNNDHFSCGYRHIEEITAN
jgi:hypothetical protein